jgi:hypothetical protein
VGYIASIPVATNLLLQSQTFDNATWGKTNSAVSANAIAAPDGTTTADLWTRSSTASAYLAQTYTKPSSTSFTYTLSVYVKKSVGDYFAMRLQGSYPGRTDATFNLETGTISRGPTVGTGWSAQSATITSIANGWYRVTLTATTDTASTALPVVGFVSDNIEVDGTDSASNSAGYIWGAQLQTGTTATDYIPTTTAAVTTYSGFVVPSALTLRVDFSRTAAASTNFNSPASIGVFNTAGNEIYITRHSSTAVRGYVVSAGTGKEAMVATVSAGQDAISAAMRAEVSNGNGAVGGTLSPGSDTATVVMPIGANSLYVGSRNVPNTPLNGPIRRIVIYPRAMSNAELQAVTIGPVSFANDNAPDDIRAALWGWVA